MVVRDTANRYAAHSQDAESYPGVFTAYWGEAHISCAGL